MTYFDDPAETRILDDIDDAWSTYTAGLAIKKKLIGKGFHVEREELLSIVRECETVLKRADEFLPASSTERRLYCRLQNFPPFAEPRVVMLFGVADFFSQLKKIKAALLHKENGLRRSLPFVQATRRLAVICEAVAQSRLPRGKRLTKPRLSERDELAERLASLFVASAAITKTKTEISAFAADVLRALGIRPPKNLL